MREDEDQVWEEEEVMKDLFFEIENQEQQCELEVGLKNYWVAIRD